MRALIWLIAIIAMAAAYDPGEDAMYSPRTSSSGLNPPALNAPHLVNISAVRPTLPPLTALPPTPLPAAKLQKLDAPDLASAVMAHATALTAVRPGRKSADPKRSAIRTELPKIVRLFASSLDYVNTVVLGGNYPITMQDVTEDGKD